MRVLCHAAAKGDHSKDPLEIILGSHLVTQHVHPLR